MTIINNIICGRKHNTKAVIFFRQIFFFEVWHVQFCQILKLEVNNVKSRQA